jgi:hypothetical protein
MENTYGNSQGLAFYTNNDQTNPSERMRLSTSGNLGVGTTTPTAKVDVVGQNGIRIRDVVTDNSNKRGLLVGGHYSNAEEDVTLMTVDSTVDSNFLRFGGGPSSSKNAATHITFFTAATNTTLDGSERMRIDPSGNVGIGTNNPLAPLDVTGDIYTTSGISTYRTAVSNGTIEATKFCTGDGETNCVTDFSALSSGSMPTGIEGQMM